MPVRQASPTARNTGSGAAAARADLGPYLAPQLPKVVGSATPVEKAQAPLDPAPSSAAWQVVWRFQTAAPIVAAPAVSAGGDVYLASAEGYLHALDDEGRVRWSRAIDGSPIGEPALDPQGNVYIATSDAIIALHADGRSSWQYFAPEGVASAAVWAPPGQLYYAGTDHCLHALSGAGYALGSRSVAQPLALAALGLAETEVALANDTAELAWRPGQVSPARDPWPEHAAPPPGTRPLEAEASLGQLWLILGGELFAFSEQPDNALLWHAPARYAAVSPIGGTVASVTEQELVWRDARSGAERRRAPLGGSASAAPALTREGLAMVPLDSGDLALFALDGASPQHIHIGSAPLWRPIWREEQRRVSIAAGNGSLVVIDVPATKIESSVAPQASAPEGAT